MTDTREALARRIARQLTDGPLLRWLPSVGAQAEAERHILAAFAGWRPPEPEPPLRMALEAKGATDKAAANQAHAEMCERALRINAPEPQAAPVAEVLERARRLAAETPPHPASGTNNCERHDFARALLAEHARAEAAERDSRDIRATLDDVRGQRDLQQRARIAAERERDECRDTCRACLTPDETTEAMNELSARAEAAEATVARLRDALADMRCKLHAANRPVLRNGLRLELRDQIDAALSAPAPEVPDGR